MTTLKITAETGRLDTTIGRNVRKLTADQGLSGRRLAAMIDMPASTFRGRLANPGRFTVNDLWALSQAFGRNKVSELLTDDRDVTEAAR